jgi:DNA polymerase-3 subunit gamma/tau
MSYQVLARRFRPLTFDEVVGQEHVTSTLANALSRGRVAHAYLFTGPRGCGKTTMARLMAKALNCDEGPTPSPCGKCPSCSGIADGTFLDVMEIDAASNTGVDNVRELRENAQYQPTAGKKRVFIIDEVHMLSKGAFNALLKTLEEPPEHVHFIFATTEPVRIPRTILSRCQRFDFRLFTLGELAERIRMITSSEDLKITDDAVELLASLAEGSMRDALSLLDQAVASTEGELTSEGILELYGLVGHEPYLDLNDAILERDARKALDLIEDLVQGGHDLVEFARALVANFRDLALLRLDPELVSRIDKPEAIKQRLLEQSRCAELADLVHLTQRAADHYTALERSPQPRWLLETQVIEYASMDRRIMLSELMGRLDALADGAPAPKSAGASVAAVAPSAPSPAPKPKPTPMPTPTAAPKAASTTAPKPVPPRTGESVDDVAPVPVSESVQPTVVEAGWKKFVEAVHQRNIGVGTCLAEAVGELGDGQLRVVFRPEHDFHRTQVAQAAHKALLSELAAETWGRPLKIEVSTRARDAEEDALARQTQSEVAPDQQQHLANRAQDNPDLGRLLDELAGPE